MITESTASLSGSSINEISNGISTFHMKYVLTIKAFSFPQQSPIEKPLSLIVIKTLCFTTVTIRIQDGKTNQH